MPEPTEANPAPTQGTPDTLPSEGQDTTNKLAGKFADASALSKGLASITEKLGIPAYPTFEDGNLIGEGRVFADEQQAVTAYKGFERMLGQRMPETNDAEPSTPLPPATPSLSIQPESPSSQPSSVGGFGGVMAKAGLDDAKIAELQATNNGKLDGSTYGKLKRLSGLSHEMIDEMIAARQVAVRAAVDDAMNIVGGSENWQSLENFARSLPKAELDSLNARLADPTQYRGAVYELMGRAAKSGGTVASAPTDPRSSFVQGVPAPSTAQPATSRDEYRELLAKAQSANWRKDHPDVKRFLASDYTKIRS